MTCELCGKSQMSVATWQVPGVIKYDACTSCARKIDELIQTSTSKLRIEIENKLGKFEGK